MAVSLPLLFPYTGGCSIAVAVELSQFSSGGKHVSKEYKIIHVFNRGSISYPPLPLSLLSFLNIGQKLVHFCYDLIPANNSQFG